MDILGLGEMAQRSFSLYCSLPEGQSWVLSTHGRWFTISHNDNSRGTNTALAFVSTVHAYTGAQIHKMRYCGVEDRGGVRENAGDPIVATMTGYFQYLYPLTQILKAPADTSIALNSGWGQFVLRQTTRAAQPLPPSGQEGDKSAEGVDGTVLTRPI